MTAAIKAQLLAAGIKPSEFKPATPSKPSRPPNPPPEARASPVAKETPAFDTSTGSPRTHLVGSYALAVGGRLHAEQLPDRLRIVITGPASEDLPDFLVSALTQFIAKP
jgi:hypothetical protein